MLGPIRKPKTYEREKLVLDAWKKVVQTQEHFNDTCMQVRTLYATVVAAILSLYGLVIKQAPPSIKIVGFDIDAIIPILLAISLSSYLFYFVDRYWYHQLLLGAVAQGAQIEEEWGHKLPEITMGAKITARSPVDISKSRFLRLLAQAVVTDARLKTSGMLHSDAKIEIFYKPLGYVALTLTLVIGLFGGIKYHEVSITQTLWSFIETLVF